MRSTNLLGGNPYPVRNSPDLISGIELTSEWTKGGVERRRLSGLAGKSVDELLKKNDEAAAKAEPKLQ